MGAIQLNKVEKWFGNLQVIKGIDLDIKDGEFVIFVGPSGCGKSTLLRLISGLEETSRGAIEIDGKDVTALPPSGRGLSMVFQSYALYPHMSVRENVGFGLKTAGFPKAEIDRKVNAAAEVLKLDEYLDRRPRRCRGDSASGWPSAVPSCASQVPSCSMNRCRTWTQRSALKCVSR